MQPEEMIFAIPLWDYAAPSFCSFSKDYYGSITEIESFIQALCVEYPNDFSELKNAWRKLKRGRKNVHYPVAYQELPLLSPCKICHRENIPFPEGQWECPNTWDCVNVFRSDGGNLEQLVLEKGSEFIRCAKATIQNLYCRLPEADSWRPLSGRFFGHPCMIHVEKQSETEFTLSYALFVAEKTYNSLEDALADCGKPNLINFKALCADIFGEG